MVFASYRKDRLWREPRLMNMLILSGIFHFLAISLLFFLPGFTYSPYIKPFPQYTPVKLISLNDLPRLNKAPEKIVLIKKIKKELRIKKPLAIQKQLEAKKIEISKVKVPKKVVASKKISPFSSKSNQKKRGKEESLSDQQEEHLQQAIRNIKEKVTNRLKAETYNPAGIKGGAGTSEIPEMVVYTSIIVDRIMESWFLPPKLRQEALHQNLLTIIDIRIDREGKVHFQGVERSSGNILYDNYALAAIKKIQSESFPPLPEVFRSPYLDLGIRFKPSEVDNL